MYIHVHVHFCTCVLVLYMYILLDMYYILYLTLYLSYLQHDELSFQEGDTLYILEKVTFFH